MDVRPDDAAHFDADDHEGQGRRQIAYVLKAHDEKIRQGYFQHDQNQAYEKALKRRREYFFQGLHRKEGHIFATCTIVDNMVNP